MNFQKVLSAVAADTRIRLAPDWVGQAVENSGKELGSRRPDPTRVNSCLSSALKGLGAKERLEGSLRYSIQAFLTHLWPWAEKWVKVLEEEDVEPSYDDPGSHERYELLVEITGIEELGDLMPSSDSHWASGVLYDRRSSSSVFVRFDTGEIKEVEESYRHSTACNRDPGSRHTAPSFFEQVSGDEDRITHVICNNRYYEAQHSGTQIDWDVTIYIISPFEDEWTYHCPRRELARA